MIYNWNIYKWVRQYYSALLRKPNRVSIAYALIAGINNRHQDFVKFKDFMFLLTSYNSQQKSLAYLLNKVFGTGSLIKVVTVSDSQPIYYAGTPLPVGIEQQYASTTAPIYASSGSPRLQGVVEAPESLRPKEGEIKAWVDHVVFADKTYKIKFY